MEYGYVRVSSITQNVDRQIKEMHDKGLRDSHIFIDYQTGKDFERENYKKLISVLKKMIF